jgi:dolichyl-phosphate-mannose--protein O-mannosyl transferase
MAQSEKQVAWFKFSLIGLFLFSLGLRFWGLERFNTLVFDETYYVKFAHNYLTQTPLFDGHPPLSKYLIALSIWIGNQLPIARDAVNTAAGAAYSTWSYRWLNALTGSFLPLVIAGIAYQLTHRRSFSFLAGFFAALDGMFLVESRYALNNVFLVILGLLGLWFLLLGLNCQKQLWRELRLAIAGIFFGASVAIKWNGLWFLLAVYGLWIAAWLIRWVQAQRSTVPELFPTEIKPQTRFHSPLQRLTRLQLWQVALNLGAIPAVFYYLAWIPHLKQNPGSEFWELQQQILRYHESVGNGTNIHPYCSNWYSWMAMLRPVAYFYQVGDRNAPIPTAKAVLPLTDNRVIYDVHSIGNPVLWWLSTAAIVLLLGILLQQIVLWLQSRENSSLLQDSDPNPTELWLMLFLAINYLANLLPWVRVTRCTFLYHYMGASVFATMAIAWLVDRWLSSSSSSLRVTGLSTVMLIVLAFVFWLPIYLGLPLSEVEFGMRMWFRSWI